jgi:hypothetical protein
MVSAMGLPNCERSYDFCLSVKDDKKDHLSDLDIIALVVKTTFSEQSVSDNTMDIKLIQYWIGILLRYKFNRKNENMRALTHFAEASCENDHLIYFTHLFEEVVDSGSLEHVEVMPVIFNLNRDNEIGLLYGLGCDHRTEFNKTLKSSP